MFVVPLNHAQGYLIVIRTGSALPKIPSDTGATIRCLTGDAKITPGFRLPARWVIHAVGPVWQGGGHQEDALLASCYRKSLELAEQHGIQTIAFPAISTGIYGFPLKRAADIAVSETKRFLGGHAWPDKVTFVCFSKHDHQVYLDSMQQLIG